MKHWNLTNDERIAAVRGLNLKDFQSVKDLEYALGVLELKVKQIRLEIKERKHNGKI